MKKALKYLISVIIVIIVAGFFIYLLIPALTGLMTLVGIVVVIAIVIAVVKKYYKQIIVQADIQYGGCQSVLLTEEKYEAKSIDSSVVYGDGSKHYEYGVLW